MTYFCQLKLQGRLRGDDETVAPTPQRRQGALFFVGFSDNGRLRRFRRLRSAVRTSYFLPHNREGRRLRRLRNF